MGGKLLKWSFMLIGIITFCLGDVHKYICLQLEHSFVQQFCWDAIHRKVLQKNTRSYYVAEVTVKPFCIDLASGEHWRATWVKEHAMTRI